MAKRRSPQHPKSKIVKKGGTKRKLSARHLTLLTVAIALFGFLLYANTISHGYVLDDFSQIKENFVTRQGLEGIPTQWQTHARYGYRPGAGELYRPLPMTMFSLEWEIAPDTPALSHFINVLLYALTGAVLFLTLVRILKNYHPLIPFLTTLFFVAHPVHVEVVANIKSRDEILMFLLSVLALNFLWKYLEKGKKSWLAAACVSYLAALFSKENAVTFVAVIPLTLYFFSKKKPKEILLLTTLFAVPALSFMGIRSQVIGAIGNPSGVSVIDNFLAGAEDTGTYLASAFLILGKYLWTLIFPHPLGSDYGYNQIPLTGFGDWRVLLSVAAWTGAGIYALIGLKKRDLYSFAILYFIITFSLFSNLVITIGTSFGERLLYTSSTGFTLLLTLLLMKAFKVPQKGAVASLPGLFSHKALLGAAGVILLLYSAKTVTRNKAWESSFTLYQKDLQVAPNSAKLNFHYGLELVKKGNDAEGQEKLEWYGKAKDHFSKAVEILPRYHDAYGQLGLAFYREKNYEKALENYNLALKYRPEFPLVHSNMGIIYFEQGNLEKAKELYEIAVKEDPRMVDALRNLGVVHALQKNFTEAIKWFSQAYQYAPDDPTINRYLGSAYRDAGQPEKGKPYLERAERLGGK